jgi:regulator of RNase E activity RraA
VDGADAMDEVERLAAWSTAFLSDCLKRIGVRNAHLAGVAPIAPVPVDSGGTALRASVVGRAATIEFGPVAEDGPAAAGGEGFVEVLATITPGQVLVVAGHATGTALCGARRTRAARQRGVAAVVVDGCVRDVRELREGGLPIFSRGVSPVSYARVLEPIGHGGPVVIAGTTVRPGDAIVADDDGVLAVPSSAVDRLIAVAVEVAVIESELDRMVAEGIKDPQAYAILQARKYF